MTTITTVAAREHFAEIINHSAYGKERIILTRRGKELAALIPVEDLKLLEALEDRIDLMDAKAALKEVEEQGSITIEQYLADLENDEQKI